MGTSRDTVDDILERLAPLDVRARAMFGGTTIYCDEKVVALVCDDRFFLKPTAAAEAQGHRFEHAPAYPGAKDSLVVGERFMRDAAAFQGLVQATADALPAPRKKKAKKKQTGQ